MAVELSRPVLNVGIVTVDFDRMSRFYCGFFGFRALPPIAFPGSGVVHRFMAGESTLRLMVPDVQPHRNGAAGDFLSATGFRYMTVAVTDVDAATAEIEEYGGTVAFGPLAISSRAKIAQIRDPDGNWIELVQEDGPINLSSSCAY
jgi:predicted enzyme related to lactoylglutathione lyase